MSSEPQDGTVIVTVRGDLDIVMSGQFDECLTRARREHDNIILDLSAVDFMDTSALAVIVGHWKKLVAAGGRLALAGARYRYTKALWITGLADRIPLYDTVAEAVGAVAPAPGTAAPTPGAAAPAPAPAAPAPGAVAPAPGAVGPVHQA